MPSGGAFETDALAGLGRGSEVWVSVVELEKNTVATESESSSRGVAVNEAGKARYAPATVVSLGVSSVEVRLRDEKMVTSVPRHHVFPANPPNLAESQNLTQLSFLNEPSVLRNLRDRYKKNKVYTNAGPVLVAVNPFKDVSRTLYGDDLVKQYMKNETKEPHVYKVVVEAYRHMRRDKKNQALIIAGESGAGKTETTKIALRCLATVSVTRGRESDLAGSNPAGDKKKDSVSYGQSGSNANTSNTKNTPTLESKLCDANPALEAFGNARTTRNDNSSRFGKLTQIGFCESGTLRGARVETYLLEKSRVVTQAIGERNYHVFYQLIAGASDIEKKEWHLADDVSFYKYCAGGRSSPNVGPGKSKQESESGASSTHIDGVDDAFQFGETQRSLRMVGLSDTEIASVFKTLAAILWLGNVEFENTEVDGEDDAARVVFGDARAALKICAKLLGARPDSLEKALTTKKLVLGGVTQDEVLKKMDAGKACETRDALAKATYASLFKWLVGKVNKSFAKEERRFQAGALESSSSETSSSESFSSGNFPSPAGWCTTLSVLDIYGFEQFNRNSFEQLCINYANEKLQQGFNKHLFTLEQDLYAAEKIDWRDVRFTDNAPCVGLIENRPVGLLALLDEQCAFPRATDATFARKCADELVKLELGNKDVQEAVLGHGLNGEKTCAEIPKTFVPNKSDPERGFTIRHFAGDVQYDPAGFLDKNKDDVSPDALFVLSSSKDEFVKTLGTYADQSAVDSNKDGSSQNHHQKKTKQSVGALFKTQLNSLVQKLDTCAPHFIRCVKPNPYRAPDVFDDQLVLKQLRCCGVLEVCRISTQGYPTRHTFRGFAERFGFGSSTGSQISFKGSTGAQRDKTVENSEKQLCVSILADHGVPTDQYQLGITKVFMRAGSVGRMEDLRTRRVLAATTFQKCHRAKTAREGFLRLKNATKWAQLFRKGKRQREWFLAVLVKRAHAASKVQSFVRGVAARRFAVQLRLEKETAAALTRKAELEAKEQAELTAKTQAELTAKTQAERDAKEHAEALEAERVRAEQREESERIETEKATEAERIAAVEKAAEAERIAADEKAAEAERIAADEKAAEAAKQEALAAAKARAEQASSVEALERKVCAESSARVAAETDAEACRVALVEARAAQKRAETELVCFKQHSVLRSVADTEINAAVANAEARVVTNCPVTETITSAPETIMSSPDELLVTSHKDIARLEAENGTLRASLADTTNRASSYQHKLFQAELEWSGEMAALQAALAAVRQALESGVPPDSKIVDSNTLGNENKLTPGRQLNGCSMETEKLSPGTPSEERERRQRSLQKQKRKAEANAVQLANVNALHDEFDSTRRVFEDDTEFIVEVREGISDAAIDPHVELKRLGQRFQEWKVDFKEKIRETRAALRRADEFECDARADSAAAELEIRNAFNEKQHRWGDDDSRPDDDDGWIDAVEDSLGRVSAPEKEKKRKGWGLKRALGLKR